MHTNTSIPPRFALLTVTALLLSACGGDSDHHDDNTGGINGLLGQYSGVYQDQEGRPVLATATVIDERNLTLVLRDDNDQPSRHAGSYDAQSAALTFADQGLCEMQAGTLNCRFDDTLVTLSPRDHLSSSPDVSTLAGTYQHRGDDGFATLTADNDGAFQVESETCRSAGQWTSALDGRLIAITVTSSSCAEAPITGYLDIEQLYAAGDTLEVQIPDTALAGFWLR